MIHRLVSNRPDTVLQTLTLPTRHSQNRLSEREDTIHRLVSNRPDTVLQTFTLPTRHSQNRLFEREDTVQGTVTERDPYAPPSETPR